MTIRLISALLGGALLVAFTAGAEAAVSVNGSKSNTYKTAAECAKAGGTWGEGRQGVGCYLPDKGSK